MSDHDAADAPRPSGLDFVAAFADALGVEAPDQATVDALLDLAGVAAHASERLAAPLACFLVGRAGADPAVALEHARRLAAGGT